MLFPHFLYICDPIDCKITIFPLNLFVYFYSKRKKITVILFWHMPGY